jgi:hypothetical protein
MKNCAWIRAVLYFFIAAIPAFITDISRYKTFSDISNVAAVIMASNFILQGLIAVRAFMDQSISRTKDSKKEVELIQEQTN